MMTLAEIQSQLDEKINTLEINSTEVQALKLLLSNAIYLNQSLATSIVLESSPTTCLLVNSAITHATSRGYSVYRGKNPRFELTNVRAKENMSVKMYDEFLSVQGYKLVYAKDYELGPNTLQNITVIFTKSVNSGSFYSDYKYAVTLAKSDISEDFILYTLSDDSDPNSTRSIIDLTTDMSTESDSMIYQSTISDYGVKLYSIKQFQNELKYYYKYLTYITDENIDYESIIKSITRLPKFDIITDSTSTTVQLKYTDPRGSTITDSETQLERLDRESDLNLIYMKSMIKNNSMNSLIRSTDDLQQIVFNSLSEYVYNLVTWIEDKKVMVRYILKDPTVPLTNTIVNNLINNIKKSYYNTELIISADNINTAKGIAFSKTLNISYKCTTDYSTAIYEAINKLQYESIVSIDGSKFDPYSIISRIYRISNDIEYVKFDSQMDDLALDAGQYPLMIDNGSYNGINVTRV